MNVTPADLPPTDGLGPGVFLGADTGWVVAVADAAGAGGAGPVSVLRTTDGGKTWPAVTVALPDAVTGGVAEATLSFPNRTAGWLLASGGAAPFYGPAALYATTDGGATWRRVGASTPNLSFKGGGLPGVSGGGVVFLTSADGWLPESTPARGSWAPVAERLVPASNPTASAS